MRDIISSAFPSSVLVPSCGARCSAFPEAHHRCNHDWTAKRQQTMQRYMAVGTKCDMLAGLSLPRKTLGSGCGHLWRLLLLLLLLLCDPCRRSLAAALPLAVGTHAELMWVDSHALGGVVCLVDAHQAVSQLKHVVAQRDDDKLRVLSALLNVVAHDGHILEICSKQARNVMTAQMERSASNKARRGGDRVLLFPQKEILAACKASHPAQHRSHP